MSTLEMRTTQRCMPSSIRVDKVGRVLLFELLICSSCIVALAQLDLSARSAHEKAAVLVSAHKLVVGQRARHHVPMSVLIWCRGPLENPACPSEK